MSREVDMPEVDIETYPAEQLRLVPGSVFALGRLGDQRLHGFAGCSGFVVQTWTSIDAAEACRILLPDARAWQVVGLLFLIRDDGLEGYECHDALDC